MPPHRKRPGIFDDIPKPQITRTPPRAIENGDGIVEYHHAIDELEQIFAEKVRSAKGNRDALETSLNNYDEQVETLIGKLAELYTKGGLDSSGTGGMVDEHQKALRAAALSEQERVETAKAEKENLRTDIDRL